MTARPFHATRAPSVRAVTLADPISESSKPCRSDIQGSGDWNDLITEVDPDTNSKPAQQPEHQACESSRKKQKITSEELRSTLIKYGELTQICYDSFYGDERDTRTFGWNKWPPASLFEETALDNDAPHMQDYTATHYLYANSGGGFCLHETHSTKQKEPEPHRYWMGYVAVSKRSEAGMRDVVFAWRGTIAHSEWHMDIQDKLVPYDAFWDAAGKKLIGSVASDHALCKEPGVDFAQGFHKMYKYSGTSVSPQEQVRHAMMDIWSSTLADEIGSITVCGHSLGGALATLCCFDLAAQGLNKRSNGPNQPGTMVPITAYTYASPRVGNEAFVDRMKQLDVKVLRSVNVRDIVPMLPGISEEERWKLDGTPVDQCGLDVFENLKLLGAITTQMWRAMMSLGKQYHDVGTKLAFDTRDHQKLIKPADKNPINSAARVHNLEVLLHLIDPEREASLMNKTEDALKDDQNVPPAFFSTPFKGMDRYQDGEKKGQWYRTFNPFKEGDKWVGERLLIPRHAAETA